MTTYTAVGREEFLAAFDGNGRRSQGLGAFGGWGGEEVVEVPDAHRLPLFG